MAKFDLESAKKRLRRGYKRFVKKPPAKLLATNFLQILAVWGIAVVQPLLGVLGKNTETFVKFWITGNSVILAVVAFTLVPPVLAVLVEGALIKWRKGMFGLHMAIVFGLGMIAALQVSKFYIHLGGALQALVALVIAAGLVALLIAAEPAGEWLRLLAIVPVIAVAMFVFNTPAGRYARGSEVAAYEVKTGTTPIVMVMFDEFPLTAILNRDGSIDADRFPNFARLASTSTWYRNYTTVAETTDFAVPTVLTGNTPKPDSSFTYVDHPDNLFTWLGGSYKMNVSEFLSQMCPPSICNESNALPGARATAKSPRWRSFVREVGKVFKQRIDLTETNEYDAINAAAAQTDTAAPTDTAGTTTLPATTTTVSVPGNSTTSTSGAPKPHNIPFIAQVQPRRFHEWVDAIPADPTGTLNFAHILLPHQSWLFLPDGKSYSIDQPEQFENESDWETKVRQQRMILQAQFTDKLLGDLLDKLDSSGAYEDSLVVIQADHGVSLDAGFSHRFISRDYSNAPDIAYPPLFVHAPGQAEGVVSDANVDSLDVLPILSDLLNTPVPWEVQGAVPEEKTGDDATNKTVWLNPHPYDIAPRPEKTLTFDAKKFQQEMFARIPHGASAKHYLDMLYGDAPFHSLIGKSVLASVSNTVCTCGLIVDTDLRSEGNSLFYIRGDVTGDLNDGDWLAFILEDKVVGLSQVFTRDGMKLFATLVYRDDYAPGQPDPTVAKINANGSLGESVPIK